MLLVCFSILTTVSLARGQDTTSIDFSGGEVGEDGVVCVVREEERDKLEQEVETQCTQQNVTQVRGMAANGPQRKRILLESSVLQ